MQRVKCLTGLEKSVTQSYTRFTMTHQEAEGRQVVEMALGRAISHASDGVRLLQLFLKQDGCRAGENSATPEPASTDAAERRD